MLDGWGSTWQPSNPPPSARSSFAPEDEWLFEVPSKKRKKSKNGPLKSYRSGPEPPTSAFDMYPLIESRSNLCTYRSSINDGLIESSSEVLLAHASLYVLAEKWRVNSLKILVLSKLHQTLSTLRLDASKVQEIIDLARYTYLDSSTPDLETNIDGLRKLISLYMAANIRVNCFRLRSCSSGEKFFFMPSTFCDRINPLRPI